MKFFKTRENQIIFSISALSAFLLALIWFSYLRQRTFDRKDAIDFAIERNSNLAVALEQYAIRTLRNADAVLQIVKMEYELRGDSLNLQKLLEKNSLNRDISEDVTVIGADGRLKKSNLNYLQDPVPNFSDRAYFIFHLRNNIDSLLISKPIISKLISKPVIVISRRLNDSHGCFAGVVALQVQPSTFTFFTHKRSFFPMILSH